MKAVLDKFGDLGTRVLSAIVMISVTVLIFWAGEIWVIGYMTIGVWIMLWEYQRLLRAFSPRAKLDLATMGIAALAAMAVAMMYGWLPSIGVLLLGGALLFRRILSQWLWMAGGLLYIGGAATAFYTIFHGAENGLFNSFWVLIIVVLSDVGGYFAGRIVGGPKLWPVVSPKKTWSGTFGGWILAATAGVLLGYFGPQTIVLSVGISLILAIAAQSGDLLESWLKRRNNVKDASDIIPGHGGLLDRLDGLLAAVWVFFALQGLL